MRPRPKPADPDIPAREFFGEEAAARFWASAAKKGDGECWVWTGPGRPGGYGYFRCGGGSFAAHRVAYALHHDTVRVPGFVCHTCDNPSCVNPAHLYLGNAKTNGADMRARGRAAGNRRQQATKFPLCLHLTGQWCKKFRGRTYYFGTDREAALKRYAAEWDAIREGRPRSGEARDEGDLTVADLANRFLHAKRRRVEAKELAPETWAHYHRMALRVVGVLGRTRRVADLQPDDFGRVRAEAAKTLGPNTLAFFIATARGMFRYAAELLGRPVRMGGQFDPPPQRVRRLHREQRGERLIPANVLRGLIAAAGPVLRAQVLLGLNCGYGATDCSELTFPAIDARPGWAILPRRKTGIPRRCPLWPETVSALKAARAARPRPERPAADGDRVFLSPRGLPCVRFREGKDGRPGAGTDSIAEAWDALCRRKGVEVPGSFYTLRHVFRTVADEARDTVAADVIMGHADDSMAAAYRERVDDERLIAVTNHVRYWLWPAAARPGKKKSGK